VYPVSVLRELERRYDRTIALSYCLTLAVAVLVAVVLVAGTLATAGWAYARGWRQVTVAGPD
jgi:hypothetical protein